MQFSLKVVLGGVALLGVYLALIRASDVPTATTFLAFVLWMLSPVWVTFGVLYWRITGRGVRRRRSAPAVVPSSDVRAAGRREAAQSAAAQSDAERPYRS